MFVVKYLLGGHLKYDYIMRDLDLSQIKTHVIIKLKIIVPMGCFFFIIDYGNYNSKNPNQVITTFEILLSKNNDDRKRHISRVIES